MEKMRQNQFFRIIFLLFAGISVFVYHKMSTNLSLASEFNNLKTYEDTIHLDSFIIKIKIPLCLQRNKKPIKYNPYFGEFIGLRSSYSSDDKKKILTIMSGYDNEMRMKSDTIKIKDLMNIYLENHSYERSYSPCWFYYDFENERKTSFIMVVLDSYNPKRKPPKVDSIVCKISYCTAINEKLYMLQYSAVESVYSFSYEEVMEMMKSIRVYKKEDE